MKKIFYWVIFIVIVILLDSCGVKDKNEKSLTTEQKQLLEIINSDLKPSTTIEAFEFYTIPMPFVFNNELHQSAFKARRMKFKPEEEKKRVESYSRFEDLKRRAEVSYHNRFIEIDSLQSLIKKQYDKLSKRDSEREFVFGLFTFGVDNGFEKKYAKCIYYAPYTKDRELKTGDLDVILVDYDLVQKALAITHSLNGTLLNYETQEKQNLDSLANTVNDPVMKFILEPVK